ncbi:hypothetical protein C8R44DRAFT_739957 [Mycena epipterygia]|nr:hypothetical protein C8R44DRAFT_739957 [Mycena epipterygia]
MAVKKIKKYIYTKKSRKGKRTKHVQERLYNNFIVEGKILLVHLGDSIKYLPANGWRGDWYNHKAGRQSGAGIEKAYFQRLGQYHHGLKLRNAGLRLWYGQPSRFHHAQHGGLRKELLTVEECEIRQGRKDRPPLVVGEEFHQLVCKGDAQPQLQRR